MSRRISVVVATFNRVPALIDLLADLAAQTLPLEQFEGIVVDDGSRPPARLRVAQVALPYRLVMHEQSNQGAAAARHAGVLAAEGEIIVFVDDDMRLDQDFLAQHLAAHDGGATVVQGYIAPPLDRRSLPLFERFHADQLDRFVAGYKAGRQSLRGIYLCTGNLSLLRRDYLALGGFDRTLNRSEDRELGVRLEESGAKLVLAPGARSLHNSDHDSLRQWMRRSYEYGVYDVRIARKHPAMEVADPWRFLSLVNPVSRPILVASAVLPRAMAPVAQLTIRTAQAVDHLGLERAALAGTTLAYGIQYFRGLRRATGSLRDMAQGFAHYRWLARQDARALGQPAKTAIGQLWRSVRGDYVALMGHRAKYSNDAMAFRDLPVDVVRKIGVQMMVAVRLMDFLRDLGLRPGAQVLSRLIRHLYSAEIHWDAQLAPGLTIIHGTGLVLSHAAKVDSGCILFHNVTLGVGTHPDTRQSGAPTLERNVHVGPGATLIGPITIGEGSKVMAGAVVVRSVPPFSVVRPADVAVVPRARSKPSLTSA